jgi:flagellar M-ring protein FliF
MDPQLLFSRLKALLSSLHAGQLASLVAAFVLVVGIVVGSAWWVNTPTYAVLYTDMEPDAAGAMVTKLKAMKVRYEVDEGGGAIRVPAELVDELRLEFASDGVPLSGRPGFEIFDRTQFGATEFQEQVNLRRALEGELARTISTLSAVSSARVHISLGKQSLFGEPTPAKASVMLKLRGGRELPPSTIAGIANLVAASVDALRPESVVIVDSAGHPLARPSGDDDLPGSAAQVERQQRLEREMGNRVVALLEPVLGPDRVRVKVALRLNSTTEQRTEETYDPATVVRSRQVTSDATTTVLAGGGLAGVRGNQPPPAPDPQNPAPPAAPPPAPAGSGASSTAETVNYEVNKVQVVTQRPPGEVARLSLAVIVDDEHVVTRASDGTQTVTRKPRTPEQLQQLQGIVAAAVGLEPERGDQITVQNVAFEEPPAVEEPPVTAIQQLTHYGPQIWQGARLLAVIVVGALAMLFFVRPLMQRAGASARGTQQAMTLAGPGQPVRTVADLESEIEAQLEASAQQNVADRRLPVLTRRVSAITQKEPENVAKLLRSWINEGER